MAWARPIPAALLIVCYLLVSSPLQAHPGDLDGNGCHYHKGKVRYHCHRDVPPNPRVDAPVRKSRANICHDSSSPNYNRLKRFVDFDTMDDCVRSGGRRHGS